MSNMIRFTYDDGENIATVTWTEQFGFIAAGDRGILERISYDEVEPRVRDVKQDEPVRRAVVTVGPARPAFGEPDEESALDTGACFSCGCSEAAHRGAEGCEAHSCRSYVP